LASLVRELFAAGAGKSVKTGLPIVAGDTPLGGDPSLVFEPLERGIKRAMLHQQNIFGLLLYRARDTLAVLLAKDQGAEDQKLQRALEQRNSGRHLT